MSKAKKPAVDDVTRKKLLYAKRFYQHGEEHARQQNPIDRMIAIHQFHAAIEITIKAVFSKLFPNEKIGFVQFNTIVKKIRSQCPWITDSRVEFLERLNERRNDVQHAAEVLATEHIPEYQVKSKDFLEDCLSQHFGIKFAELDLADAINDEKIREALLWVKEYIEMGEYEDAVALCKGIYKIVEQTFDERLHRLESLKTQIGSRLRLGRGGRYVHAIKDQNLRAFKDDFLSAHSETIRAFENLIDELLELFKSVISVGESGNWSDKQHFLSVYPDAAWMQSGNLRYLPIIPAKLAIDATEEEAVWVREYVIRSIIDWQDRGFEPKWRAFELPLFESAQKQIEAKRKEAAK